MRIGVATVYTPGIDGGAELHVEGLQNALKRAGHMIHSIRMPFSFEPATAIKTAINHAEKIDFTPYNGGKIDALICLKFPAYLFSHPRKAVWLLHQHRSAYDLYDTPFGWQKGRSETDRLRDLVIEADSRALGDVGALFTNSKRVSARLLDYNSIKSRPLYHPPAGEDAFHCAKAMPYIYAPSRLETLKRQDLLLRAVAASKMPVQVIFSGTGGQYQRMVQLAHELGIEDRVRFVGAVSRAEVIALYANASAVFFGPLDEDYGYVTLEAMLSSKPVITCTDSGGPLEFVLDGETGFITAPEPEAVAAALAAIVADPARAEEMGRAGLARYRSMSIGWDHVVETILSSLMGETQDPSDLSPSDGLNARAIT